MQMTLMAAMSVLAGLIAAGAVWLGWDLAVRMRSGKQKRAEDAALLATAKEAPPQKRPK